jgi:hypothetical protein
MTNTGYWAINNGLPELRVVPVASVELEPFGAQLRQLAGRRLELAPSQELLIAMPSPRCTTVCVT